MVAAGAAGVIAATPAAAQETRTLTLPAELVIESQYDDPPPGNVYNCTSAAIIRWKIVPNVVESKGQRVFYTDTQSTLAEGRVDAFPPFKADTFIPGPNRNFSAPPGTHQVVLQHNGGSNLGSRPDCETVLGEYAARFNALRVEVQVPVDSSTPSTPEGGTTPGAPPGAETTRQRYRIFMNARWGKRAIRTNKLRRVPRNARIVVNGRTAPQLGRTRMLVQRRTVIRTRTPAKKATASRGKVRTVVRWRTIRRVTTKANGRFRFVYRAAKPGRNTLRVTLPGNQTRVRSVGPQLRLAVRAPRKA